jgi:GDP-4-dehydro-6-deoxy-D-mannose reductase
MTCVVSGTAIVVTGATGFVGRSLVKQLADRGYRVIGISESPEPSPTTRDYLHDYISADLTRGWPQTGPFDGLVHLAGLAAVGPSFDRPQDYLTINSSMVTNIFEQVLRSDWTGRALIVSSGAVYGGGIPDDDRFNEDSTVIATSPYVVSKLLIEKQTEYYQRRGIDAVVVRPFNHIGPGQGPGFIVPDLAGKILEWDSVGALPVGNLDSARDYTDVRDIVNAYALLLENEQLVSTTYNICSGTAHTGWEVLEAVCSALGRPVPPTQVVADRAIDPSVITGNADRLKIETGWSPQITLRKSVSDFVASLES